LQHQRRAARPTVLVWLVLLTPFFSLYSQPQFVVTNSKAIAFIIPPFSCPAVQESTQDLPLGSVILISLKISDSAATHRGVFLVCLGFTKRSAPVSRRSPFLLLLNIFHGAVAPGCAFFLITLLISVNPFFFSDLGFDLCSPVNIHVVHLQHRDATQL
jgi:hypothetical protein